MAIKYKNGAVRLWDGVSKKTGNYNIGIKLDKKRVSPKKAAEVHHEIDKLLTKKFGIGVI